jgi:hypothetical protein
MSKAAPPPALFPGHCTPEKYNNAGGILINDLFDDSGSYSDGEDTDDNDNFQLLIKAANSDKRMTTLTTTTTPMTMMMTTTMATSPMMRMK